MRSVQGIVAIALAATVAGCVFYDDIEVFNNTGTGLEIRSCDRGERVGDGLTAKLKPWCLESIEVRSALGVWRYRVSTDSYIASRIGVRTDKGNYRVRLQLQSDGSIGVVPPGVGYPVGVFVKQPEGFPVQPYERLTSAAPTGVARMLQ
jgi:hypothetical protein